MIYEQVIPTVTNWSSIITATGLAYWDKVSIFFPKLLWALVILLLGKVLAKWAKRIVSKLSEATGVVKILDIAGLDELIEKLGFKITIAAFLGSVVYWGIMLIFFVAALDILGLREVSNAVDGILNYIPNVISTTLILALGLVAANLVSDLISRSFKAVEVEAAQVIGSLARAMIILFVILAAINELGIAQDFIRILFAGIVFALSLGLGLSFGLGCKNLMGKVVTDWYAKISRDKTVSEGE